MTYRADHPAITPALDYEPRQLSGEQLLAVAVLKQAVKDQANQHVGQKRNDPEIIAFWAHILDLGPQAVQEELEKRGENDDAETTG